VLFRSKREQFIDQVIAVLRQELAQAGLKAEVSGRPKHIYSIHQKMEKYAAQGKQFEDIYDVLALRVLADSIPDCYHAMGIVHSLWHPIPGAFDDFIANPKPNGYQSLHTAVMSLGTTPLEVQVRTYEMHHIAEYGVAAHWRYKEGDPGDKDLEQSQLDRGAEAVLEFHHDWLQANKGGAEIAVGGVEQVLIGRRGGRGAQSELGGAGDSGGVAETGFPILVGGFAGVTLVVVGAQIHGGNVGRPEPYGDLRNTLRRVADLHCRGRQLPEVPHRDG
jgi:ppGpp synthetase/RelA/SpoT-type nucleotidyltranferase